MTATSLPSFFFLVSLWSYLSQSEILNRSCNAGGSANYSVTFSAKWSPFSFPKQYPTYRPPAQWSLLFGCIHNSDFVLWAEGSLVSPGVQVFVEHGKSQLLVHEIELLKDEVRSWFQADAVPTGEGNTSTVITLAPSHPLVSVLLRIIPSPDWFVGISALDLCENGQWKTRVLYDLFPWDAGTDSGFTFSSPNFVTNPQEPVSQITAKNPSHPANSFYYPKLETLPRLGYLEFNLLPTEKDNETEYGEMQGTNVTAAGNGTQNRTVLEEVQVTWNQTAAREETGQSLVSTPLDCEVSMWSSWGLCSRLCGKGTRERTRYIVVHPANDGEPCSTLLEKEDCEDSSCPSASPLATNNASTDAMSRKSLNFKWIHKNGSSEVMKRRYRVFLTNSTVPRNKLRNRRPNLLRQVI
ncbi:spondin-2-like [Rhinatrema bivittatum]|uniref:spondin-2-like n=1 Tax=Rhinatrema bivittatum TaxID=194408 RepID=UPI0011272C9A|nr:spondin-2-like [Rhinatrema bivittatum]